jgi:hypothetical protein
MSKQFQFHGVSGNVVGVKVKVPAANEEEAWSNLLKYSWLYDKIDGMSQIKKLYVLSGEWSAA